MLPGPLFDFGLSHLVEDIDGPVERKVEAFMLVQFVQLLKLGVRNGKVCVSPLTPIASTPLIAATDL